MALASIDPDPQRQVYGNLVELSIFSDFIFFNLSFISFRSPFYTFHFHLEQLTVYLLFLDLYL